MADRPDTQPPSTPEAAAAVAQTRVGRGPAGIRGPADLPPPVEGTDYVVGPGVARAARGRPYERRPGDPLYRPLRIYTLDPATSRREGGVALVNVPYEPLRPGPAGAVLRVDARDADTGDRYLEADLDDPAVLIRNGRDPSPADPRFHQQMVYAVCSLVYAAFRSALGRHVAWGFGNGAGSGGDGARLVVRPHGGRARNAWYDPAAGELRFGYFQPEGEVQGRNVPQGFVFTCLSHDVVAHEVTHALLDGLRARFAVPTGPDVLGFHEGFADLVAIFQHFSYPEVVREAIRTSRGEVEKAHLLTALARQFGHTSGSGGPLRSAVRVGPGGEVAPLAYRPDMGAHEMGSVLVSAVFDAFAAVFRHKTERYVRLATGGTAVLPPGEIPADLQAVLAKEASRLASQFLAVCIRAVDYCPPVDLELGEFLRAVLTADHDLVPDDPWGYREAWIDAFARHGIYPPNVRSLAEDELRWSAPERRIGRADALSFRQLRFDGDPGCAADEEELLRQARELGRLAVRHPDAFGLARPGDPRLEGDRVSPPRVESIRSCRRVGPDGQVVFDLVGEVIQERRVRTERGEMAYLGGATVILDPRGEVRYVVAKNILNPSRLERQRKFVRAAGVRYWTEQAGRATPAGKLFALMHGG
jgi:hypothetical protein